MRRNVTFERAGIALQGTVKREAVWELKYWGLRTLNNDKFELLFNTMNKKYSPLMYSFVLCRVFIVLVDFRLHCVTTPFMKGVTVVTQWSWSYGATDHLLSAIKSPWCSFPLQVFELIHVIAADRVCFKSVCCPFLREYPQRVVYWAVH